jgi:DNA recombination protein RmuC
LPSDATSTVPRLVIVGLLIGLVVGAVVAWLVARARVARLETELAHEREHEDRFRALSGATVDRAVETATERIGVTVEPLKAALAAVSSEVAELEKARNRDYGAITTGLAALTQTTGSLATALRSPSVRGQWGELQLRNAVEAAGMLKFCDFTEQTTASSDDGRFRPDAIVRLPGGRQVVVDAKAPLQALLDAEAAADPAERERFLDAYVRHVRDHVAKLAAKAYWQQFSPTPDFVILFLPGEGFYRAAIERDPHLIELAPGQRVHIASPSTLITLLRAIAVGWREADVAENARAIEKLGRELYERLATMTDHFATLGKRLDGAVQAYNQGVGSLERRVLVSARRFVEHGVGTDKELESPAPIEVVAHPPQTIELPARAIDAA